MIRRTDERAIWAYELGFAHGGNAAMDAPIRGQADPFYILGFNAARAA